MVLRTMEIDKQLLICLGLIFLSVGIIFFTDFFSIGIPLLLLTGFYAIILMVIVIFKWLTKNPLTNRHYQTK